MTGSANRTRCFLAIGVQLVEKRAFLRARPRTEFARRPPGQEDAAHFAHSPDLSEKNLKSLMTGRTEKRSLSAGAPSRSPSAINRRVIDSSDGAHWAQLHRRVDRARDPIGCARDARGVPGTTRDVDQTCRQDRMRGRTQVLGNAGTAAHEKPLVNYRKGHRCLKSAVSDIPSP
jgi:hypothetical protein